MRTRSENIEGFTITKFYNKNEDIKQRGEQKISRYQHWNTSYTSEKTKLGVVISVIVEIYRNTSMIMDIIRPITDMIYELRELEYPRRIIRAALDRGYVNTGCFLFEYIVKHLDKYMNDNKVIDNMIPNNK